MVPREPGLSEHRRPAMAKKKTHSTKARRARYTFPIEITSGGGDSRVSRRTLTYPKPPVNWTALDLVIFVRSMARLASQVRRKPITHTSMTVWFEGRDGATEITASHAYGAWATLRGHALYRMKQDVPTEAMAVFVALSTACYD